VRYRWLWGAAAIAVYVTAALALANTGRVVPRPLYDGLAPAAPYRYVSPPPDLAEDNEPPLPGKGVVDFAGKRSEATSISTGDGQLQIVLQKGAFRAKAKEKSVEVTLDPIPAAEPHDIDGGHRIEGNAYRVGAEYARSKDAAELSSEATIVLRYPHNGKVLVRREGSGWRRLDDTQVSQSSLQLFGATDRLGVFAAAGVPPSTWTRWIPYGAGALGLAAGVFGYLSGRRGWFHRGRERAKVAPKSKRGPGKRKPPSRPKRRPGKQV
jgi:hypothetical protein